MSDDFARYGLNQLPLEPPDDPNTMFSSDAFASSGMQRTGQKHIIPAQFQPPTEPPNDQTPLHSPNDVVTSAEYDDARTKYGEAKAHGGLTYVPLGNWLNYYQIQGGLGHKPDGFYARLPNGNYAYFPPGTAIEQTLDGTTRIIDRNGKVLATYSGS